MPAEGVFPSTCWSRIRVGEGAGTGEEAAAYEVLARDYQAPIRAYLGALLRSAGPAAPDRDDVAQDFFAWMLQTGFLGKADPSRGRFRAFLKVALRNYVRDEGRRARAAIRGGGVRPLPFAGSSDEGAADPGVPEPEDPAAERPDEALDRSWRAAVVNRALAALETELSEGGRSIVYRVFRDHLLAPGRDESHAAIAARHGVSRVDVQNFVQRARARFRAHVKQLVLETVRGPDDLADELRWLLGPAAGGAGDGS